MTGDLHPLASHHLPFFITAPGETDQLLVIVGLVLLGIVVMAGVFYFHLHAIPERMGHGRANKVQFEIVAVLALLALFTHNNLFWVAALLLAMVTVPDFQSPLNAMAAALTKMAGRGRAKPDEVPEAPAPDPAADAGQAAAEEH